MEWQQDADLIEFEVEPEAMAKLIRAAGTLDDLYGTVINCIPAGTEERHPHILREVRRCRCTGHAHLVLLVEEIDSWR